MILSGSVIGGSSVACDSAISVAALSASATAPASAPPAIAARKVGYRFAEPAPQIHDPVTDNRAVGAVSRRGDTPTASITATEPVWRRRSTDEFIR